MAKDILSDLKKLSGNEYAFLMTEDDNPYKVKGWVDTGCYLLNAALSDGDLTKGLPLGKRIVISGEPSVAKSLFTMYIIKAYLNQVPDAKVIFFESEGSSVLEMAESLSLPKDNFLILPVGDVTDFNHQATKILNKIKEMRKGKSQEDAPKFIMCLDSLSMMHSKREYKNALDGNEAKDMSKAGDIRSVFRNITLDLSLTQTPLIVTNHVYDNIGGYGNQKIQSGGKGISYAGDVILVLTKAKEKDGNSRVGSQITVNISKSRFQREDTKYKIILLFSKGVYKYSGLLEYALEFNIWKKEGHSILINDEKVKRKTILKSPEQYFTDDVINQINEKLKCEVGFGDNGEDFFGEDDDENDDQ